MLETPGGRAQASAREVAIEIEVEVGVGSGRDRPEVPARHRCDFATVELLSTPKALRCLNRVG